MQRTAPQGSPRTPTARIAATTPRLIVRILNPVFLTFKGRMLPLRHAACIPWWPNVTYT